MTSTFFGRLHRWMAPRGDESVLHAWTNEDSNWHGSSFDLARGLEVTEMLVSSDGIDDRPRAPTVILDAPSAVYRARG